ncbi:M48 family metallopeptidase [Telmatobacter bradus]|uniref:M48 family metallopeptidase n=1 Tax=Telmatobacter bradus TaxID=474953 RepID=UPI003B4294DD
MGALLKLQLRWLVFPLFLLLVLPHAALANNPTPIAPTQDTASPQPPTPAQTYNLPPDKLAKAVALGHIHTALDLVDSLWSIGFVALLLATGWAARIAGWLEERIARRWLQGLAFFAVYLLLSTLASLPLELLGHTASLHYGISIQGWASWFGDQGKALGIGILVGPLLMLLFHWLVRVSPRLWWLGIWAVAMPLTLLAIFATPLVIDPLFNKFEPLEQHHAALVAKLETVVARTGNRIPPERMFLMKASDKSNGLNAYVTGIGSSKRYVMWDTATDRLPDDEILFIFGHESGHYMLNHIPKEIAFSSFGLLALLFAGSRFAGSLAKRKATSWKLTSADPSLAPLATRQGFLLVLLTVSLLSLILQPASNALSRHFEHEADVYGQEAIHGLVADPQKTAVSAFNHLGEAWLEDPAPNPLVEFWEFNHPSVQHRSGFAAQYNPWAAGGHGRFFAQ